MAASGTKQEPLQVKASGEDLVALNGSWRVEGHQGVREDREMGLLGVMGLRVYLGFKTTYFYASAPFQDLPREAGEKGDDKTTNDVPHIQCEDGCDPQALRDNSQVLR